MKKLISLIILLFFIFTESVSAQFNFDWRWLHQSPQGNDLRWTKMWDVNTIYAIGNKGTFIKTTNRGVTWFIQNRTGRISGIPAQVSDLRDAWFFDQNTGIVAGTYGSIFRTTNGGMTFDSTVNPIPTNTTITGISFINNNTGYVISGLTNYRLMKTTDGGVTWNAAPGSPPYSNPYYVYAFNENKILVLNQLGDVCITTNGGSVWNTYPIGSQVNFYKAVFLNANTGYACGDWGRCRYTNDGGFTWTNMSGVLFDRNIHFFDVKYRNGFIYLTGNSNYLWRSSNLGVTWDSIPFIAPSAQVAWSNYYYSTDMSATGDTMFTAGARGSMHQSIGNANFLTHSQYFKTGSLKDVWTSSNGQIIIAAGFNSSTSPLTNDQILRSVNGGTNWSVVSLSPASTTGLYSIDMIDDNTGYVCGNNSAVYKTTNGGVNWDSLIIPNMPNGIILTKVDFVNSQTGWIFSKYAAGNDSTIYKTTNGGANWFKQKLNVTLTSDNTVNSACMIDANSGWLLNAKPRPWKTTNGGATWDSTKLSDNYLAGSLYDIKMVNMQTGYCCGANMRVYKTNDGGVSPWANISYSSTTVITNYTLEVVNPQFCVVMGTYGTVYYTSNGGLNWINKNLFSSIEDISGSYLAWNTEIFAVTNTNSCVLKNIVYFTGINTKQLSSIPSDYKLFQNYPNPFNPSTNIKFQIPGNSFITVKIFDVLGREVETLLNEPLSAGTFEINWNAADFPSGIYFYKLTAGDFSDTKRMILLK